MNKKKVIIGVVMAAIFIMMAFVPVADNMHTAQSNTALPQQVTAYQLNNQTTPHFLLNHPNITSITALICKNAYCYTPYPHNCSCDSWYSS